MGKLNLSDTKLGWKRLRGNMTYFDKMVKDMRNKDLDAIQDWLHPDFYLLLILKCSLEKTGLRKLRESSIEMKSHFMIMLDVLCRMST